MWRIGLEIILMKITIGISAIKNNILENHGYFIPVKYRNIPLGINSIIPKRNSNQAFLVNGFFRFLYTASKSAITVIKENVPWTTAV